MKMLVYIVVLILLVISVFGCIEKTHPVYSGFLTDSSKKNYAFNGVTQYSIQDTGQNLLGQKLYTVRLYCGSSYADYSNIISWDISPPVEVIRADCQLP